MELEKKSLETHVVLCTERYISLEKKLCKLEERIDVVEQHLVDIKDSLSNTSSGQYKALIGIGTTILAALVTAVVTLLMKLVGK